MTLVKNSVRRSALIASALATLLLVAAAPLVAARAAEKQAASPRLRSRILIYSLADGKSHPVFADDSVWEAPNWSPDGKALIVNHDGTIYKLVLGSDGTAKPERLMLGRELNCNNDKSLSPDGKQLAFSASSPSSPGSEVYLAQAGGTGARQMTRETPSYFHGWSPDGRTLAFVAKRNGSDHFNIDTMPAAGGPEMPITAVPHHNDGPDYSPDGRWMYINSDRSGKEAIWRLPVTRMTKPDQGIEMVLSDALEDWFPHISPDGKRMVYIGYPAGTPTHDPRGIKVAFKLAGIDHDRVSASARTLVTTTGGQGSMNVNSWAPDSKRFAYVEYDPLP